MESKGVPPISPENIEEIQSDDSGLPDFPSRGLIHLELSDEEVEVVIEEDLEDAVASGSASSSSKGPSVAPPRVE